MTSIEALYAAHPELYSAEHEAEHRVERRLGILDLVQPGTVGAELGVFTGLFAEAILETVRPAALHLVDPWWLAYGDLYPDWGAYTAGGALPTHYRPTLEELRLLRDKLRPDGLVLGDDWKPEPNDPHHGVFRAVHELVREGMWDLLRADEQRQWAIRPAAEYRRRERYRQAFRARVNRLLRR
jgi:LmbE family N-acetylglucosaminyl deacetylase